VTPRLTSVIPLVDRNAPRRVVSLRDERSVATAQALDWPGVMFEAGRNDIVEVDELTPALHYFGVNADDRPVTIEVKEPTGYRSVTLAPGTGWLNPAGQGFSLRVRGAGPHAYVRVAFDPIRFERFVSMNVDGPAPAALERSYHVGGPQVRHLIEAMASEAREGAPSGIAFVESLTTALGLQLLRQAGVAAPAPPRIQGGLAPAVRRRILEMMDAHPDAHFTIDVLAREAGLSPAHFARAFRETVGRAPHQHLLMLRLERARRLLDRPDANLSDVALRSGFADQAHLTRFFKRQFGVTPGAFVRARRQ